VVTPEVPGRVEVLGPSMLAFRPAQGFAPGVDYRVHLAAVATADGPLEVPSGAGVVAFATPHLDFVRLLPTRTAAVSRRASGLELQLVFSGPVDLASARGRVKVEHSALGDVTRQGSVALVEGYPNRLAFVLRGPAVEREGTFTATVAAGYGSPVARVAGRGGSDQWKFDPTGPAFKVLAAHLVEGTNGFSIEVVCDDEASKGYKRWHWFDHLGDSFRTSPRCLPTDESARDLIALTPAVDYSIVQGRGGFRIQAPLQRGGVQLTLSAGLTTVDGGTLGETTTYDLTVPALSPPNARPSGNLSERTRPPFQPGLPAYWYRFTYCRAKSMHISISESVISTSTGAGGRLP
jgi:hypothetical protein